MPYGSEAGLPSDLNKEAEGWTGAATTASCERRRFLEACAVGALSGLAWERRSRAGLQSSSKPRLAVETSMFHRLPSAETFQQIRRAGFRFVELGGSHFRSTEFTESAAGRLKAELADAGLTPIAAFIVHQISNPDETQRQAAVEQWKRSFAAVKLLGIDLVTTELTGSVAHPEEGKAAFQRSMEQILPLLAEAQLHLSVEPHPGDFFEAAAPTIELLRSYHSPHLGYLHCTPHSYYLGPTSEVVKQAGKMLSHVHLADTFRTERIMARTGVGLHLHLRPGLGEIDFKQVFTALEGVAYSGFASLQLLSHDDEPGQSIQQAREYLQALLGDRVAI